MLLMEGKTALVTGSTSGIGKQIAYTMAEQGANVILCGRNDMHGQAEVKELSQKYPSQKFWFYKIDLLKAAEFPQKIVEMIQGSGDIDILVNNAGITRDTLFLRMSLEQWEEVFLVNLTSAYHFCKSVLRSMISKKRGKIINISSIVGIAGNAGQVNYSASKAGLIGFTKSLAREVGSRGICVNCIAPGFIATPMTDDFSEEKQQAILQQIPLKRLGLPEDVAKVVLFLASHLSDYITGQVITVDGGMLM